MIIKTRVMGLRANILIFIFIPILEIFPRVFLCVFDFQTLCFLTLELIYLSYLLGSLFSEKKNWFVVEIDHQVVNLPSL